ncbi:copper chaperone PCu(A)C [Sphingomonas morindae]|uniref:Copper chaperone PCu(A)C n=1 Tax=Sphingomonas morindae TaxID=1541170 RepID=A0ABY4X8K1_9SPHN|nr:copper chaperone PCu(A)C [Sphingomonas morindae]USI73225.1 copper chaperone PCu(A)C [Sphingomonas morindae]
MVAPPASRRVFMLLAASAALLPGACQRGPGAEVRASQAWVRLAAVPGRPAAAYLTLHGADHPVRLLAVESPAAGSSELHETLRRIDDNGGPPEMTMDRLDYVDIPTGATIAFAPQAMHVMLFGVAPALKPGDRVPLVLRFAKGAPLTIKARAIAAGDPAPY